MKIEFAEDEFWYGTCVKYGMKMPICREENRVIDFT